MRIIALAVYSLFLLPIWVFVRLTGQTRFGRRFHGRETAWDYPVSSRPDSEVAIGRLASERP